MHRKNSQKSPWLWIALAAVVLYAANRPTMRIAVLE